jgi:hypothetical protein
MSAAIALACWDLQLQLSTGPAARMAGLAQQAPKLQAQADQEAS